VSEFPASTAKIEVLGPVERRVEAFLYREAHLLDDERFFDWLELFTEDSNYWVAGDHDDPRRGISLIYDDRTHLGERIDRLQSGLAASQSPRTLTTHTVSTVLGTHSSDGSVRCVSKQVVHHARGERLGFLPATVEHLLVPQGDSFAIRRKKVALLTRRQTMSDLSFLL
jgi:3-phenylpropionate/cinnamic acid dioxygenase small subunit